MLNNKIVALPTFPYLSAAYISDKCTKMGTEDCPTITASVLNAKGNAMDKYCCQYDVFEELYTSFNYYSLHVDD